MFANIDDGSCENLAIYGCTDYNYIEFDFEAMLMMALVKN